ncbi:MAG: SH3 domain-containing protein [Desulfobulbaceae bacterium]|nr:SH3 domain-containing protein [Desulfobulbaceae bacterium]
MKRLFLIVTLIFLSATTASAIRLVSVAGENVNMHTGPGEDQAVLWVLGEGYPLQVIGSQGLWLKISDFEGDEGWVNQNLVNRVPHLIVKKRVVNIRQGPGTNYEIVGKIPYGIVVKTIEKNNNGWVKIEQEDGQTGWVLRTLLWGW